MRDKIIAASIMGTLFLLMAICSWISFFENYNIATNGVEVIAEVIEIKDTDATEPERDFYLSYEYEGKTYTFCEDYVVWSDVEVGDKVDALVNPRKPDELAFSHHSNLSQMLIPVMLTLCTIGIIFYYLYKKSDD